MFSLDKPFLPDRDFSYFGFDEGAGRQPDDAGINHAPKVFSLYVVVLAISFLGFPTPVKADDPVTDLLRLVSVSGKLVEQKCRGFGVWQAGMALLDQRLKELENNAWIAGRDVVMRSASSGQHRRPRHPRRVPEDGRKGEYRNRLFERRLDDLEEQVEELEK